MRKHNLIFFRSNKLSKILWLKVIVWDRTLNVIVIFWHSLIDCKACKLPKPKHWLVKTEFKPFFHWIVTENMELFLQQIIKNSPSNQINCTQKTVLVDLQVFSWKSRKTCDVSAVRETPSFTNYCCQCRFSLFINISISCDYITRI